MPYSTFENDLILYGTCHIYQHKNSLNLPPYIYIHGACNVGEVLSLVFGVCIQEILCGICI